MRFEPKKYLNELVAGRGSGLVKIIMGVRRCGKSFLLLGLISIGGISFGKRFAVHTVGEKLGRGHPIGQCDCWRFAMAKGFGSTFFPGPYRPLGPSPYG